MIASMFLMVNLVIFGKDAMQNLLELFKYLQLHDAAFLRLMIVTFAVRYVDLNFLCQFFFCFIGYFHLSETVTQT